MHKKCGIFRFVSHRIDFCCIITHMSGVTYALSLFPDWYGSTTESLYHYFQKMSFAPTQFIPCVAFFSFSRNPSTLANMAANKIFAHFSLLKWDFLWMTNKWIHWGHSKKTNFFSKPQNWIHIQKSFELVVTFKTN